MSEKWKAFKKLFYARFYAISTVAILMLKPARSQEVGVYRDSRHSLNVFGLFSLSLGKMCSKNRESLNLPLARGWHYTIGPIGGQAEIQ
eukprot:scaffold5246_cov185-Chaetoceros_neogracile.AAC.1